MGFSRSTKLRVILPLITLFAVVLMPLADIGNLSVQAAKPLQPQEAPRLPPLEQPLPSGTGGRPPEMDLSHLTGQTMPEALLAQALASPASFDWRTQGKVTSVKDQGACGSCYAFAIIGNIESKMLIDGAGSYDFSENSAKECNWRELNDYTSSPWGPWGSCDGGNYDMLANLFSQKGLVLESCNPYVPADVACTDTCPYQITLLDWRVIAGNVVPNTEVLKSYIQTYGPVYARMYMDTSQGFNGLYDGSYTFNYITPAATGADHCVLIVGWSNNLPPVSGSSVPADGWIVKNSWGTSWGDNGYFYMTYDSANIGMNAAFMYDWQYYDDNGSIMYYDDDGWSGQWGYGDTTAGGLAKFLPPSDTSVTRVEFWTTDRTTDIDVYIYDNFDGTEPSTLLWYSLNNKFDEAGYHGVTVNPPLAVDSGDDVIVVVKFTNSSYNFPIPVDKNGPYVTGRTYMSHTGASGTWYDLGAGHQVDIGVRLRTSAGNDPPNAPSNPSPANHANGISINADLSWSGEDPDPGDTVTYDVYFGTSANPPLVSNDQAGTTYDLGALAYNTEYYWQVVATDNHAASTSGPAWDFTTGSAPNNPPNMPSNPSPANQAAGVLINADLSWTGGDPDAADAVTYDVYFGTSSTPPIVSDSQPGTSYDPGALSYNTKYYWKVVATDSHVVSTTGPLWDFTTVIAGTPDITVSPTSFDVMLPSNTIQSYTMTVANSGGATLTYAISDSETTGGGGVGKGESLFLMEPATVALEIPLQSSPAEPEEIGAGGWQNIMSDGFEGTFPGTEWGLSANPTWGKESYEHYTGSYSVWCAGSSYNPPSNYPNNMEAWMVYGPFSLADTTDAELNFYCWLDTEEDYDYLWWLASKDFDGWYGWRDSGDSGDWVNQSFDLTAVPTLGDLRGELQVWVAFVFTSDGSVSGGGAFVDDVVLRKYVPDTNNPPNEPSSPAPLNHATGVSVNADLSWTGGDPDPGDTVTYDVYFGSSATPPLVSNDQPGTTYDPGALAYNTKYYWWILASDDRSASMIGPLWDFTTGGAVGDCPWLDENPKSGSVSSGGSNDITVTINTAGLTVGNTYTAEIVIANNDPDENPRVVPVTLLVVSVVNSPPNIPFNPSPPDNSTSILTDADLSWSGGDPDAGDTVTYDVYFGTSSPPPLKETLGPYPATQSSINYDPGALVHDTRYYWRIVPRDNHGITAGGSVWDFTTGKTGDANGDGVVDTGDITKVKRIYFELDPPMACADVNRDGFIDTGDITAIKVIYFGV